MDLLPNELLDSIIALLSPTDFRSALATCHRIRRVAEAQQWRWSTLFLHVQPVVLAYNHDHPGTHSPTWWQNHLNSLRHACDRAQNVTLHLTLNVFCPRTPPDDTFVHSIRPILATIAPRVRVLNLCTPADLGIWLDYIAAWGLRPHDLNLMPSPGPPTQSKYPFKISNPLTISLQTLIVAPRFLLLSAHLPKLVTLSMQITTAQAFLAIASTLTSLSRLTLAVPSWSGPVLSTLPPQFPRLASCRVYANNCMLLKVPVLLQPLHEETRLEVALLPADSPTLNQTLNAISLIHGWRIRSIPPIGPAIVDGVPVRGSNKITVSLHMSPRDHPAFRALLHTIRAAANSASPHPHAS